MEELLTTEVVKSTQEELKWCVYIHTSPSNKVYIGITSKNPPEKRWLNGRGYSHNYYFTNAIKLYGWDNFKHEVVASDLTVDEAMIMERQLIEKYKSMDKRYGYNLTSGGEMGKALSQESRDKISKANSNPTEETRRKMSESAKARCTDEWRQTASERAKGQWSGENNPNYDNHNWNGENNPNYKNKIWADKQQLSHSDLITNVNNPMFGKKHTEESKRKMSVNRKGKLVGKDNPRARAIVQLTKDNEFIRKWDYVTQAADYLEVKPWNIITCCSCPEKLKSAYGYKWMYLEDYEKITHQNDLKNIND